MNIVQFEGGDLTNHTVTSRAELLKAAREIAFQEGAGRLSIRALSQRCGIAIGSVYNYFPSKAELMLSLVEEFWRTVFHPDVCALPENLPFPDFLEAVYFRLSSSLREFQAVFLEQLDALCGNDKARGKLLEERHLAHIRSAFAQALENSPGVNPEIWSERFSPTALAAFLFDHMLLLLKNGEPDCSFLKETARRLLQLDA